jgi:hypothetical protein
MIPTKEHHIGIATEKEIFKRRDAFNALAALINIRELSPKELKSVCGDANMKDVINGRIEKLTYSKLVEITARLIIACVVLS